MATEYGRSRCRSCGVTVAQEAVTPVLVGREPDATAPWGSRPVYRTPACGIAGFHHHLDGRCQSGQLVCLSCGSERLTIYSVTGRERPDVICGPVCQGARGVSCDCQCGGRNHGIGGAA